MPLHKNSPLAMTMATQYATINLSALKKTPLYEEIKQIAADTEGFSDEELCEIYEVNFRLAYQTLQLQHPEVLKATAGASTDPSAAPVPTDKPPMRYRKGDFVEHIGMVALVQGGEWDKDYKEYIYDIVRHTGKADRVVQSRLKATTKAQFLAKVTRKVAASLGIEAEPAQSIVSKPPTPKPNVETVWVPPTPKFKVGDLVLFNGAVRRVDEVRERSKGEHQRYAIVNPNDPMRIRGVVSEAVLKPARPIAARNEKKAGSTHQPRYKKGDFVSADYEGRNYPRVEVDFVHLGKNDWRYDLRLPQGGMLTRLKESQVREVGAPGEFTSKGPVTPQVEPLTPGKKPRPKGEKAPKAAKAAKAAKTAKTPKLTDSDNEYLAADNYVKALPVELKHFRKYVALADGGTKDALIAGLTAIQRDIRKSLIGKSSPNVDAIMDAQREYLAMLKEGKAPYRPGKHLDKMRELAQDTKVYKTVEIILAVTGWSEQDKTAEQCKKMLSTIRNAKLKHKIKPTDPYAAEVDLLQTMLESATSGKHFTAHHVDLAGLRGMAGLAGLLGTKKAQKKSDVEHGDSFVDFFGTKATFYRGDYVYVNHWDMVGTYEGKKSGSNRVIIELLDGRKRSADWTDLRPITVAQFERAAGVEGEGVAGLGDVPQAAPAPAAPASTWPVPAKVPMSAGKPVPNVGIPALMSSADMARIDYKTYPFTGDWLGLIGRPATNFKLMIWGEPGMGKSTLAIMLARYLALAFGPVLYCSSEEYPSYTLNEKVERVGGAVAGWDFSKSPSQLRPFHKFLILDSLNHFGWGVDDLKRLVAARPDLSIILILQATKKGGFKGGADIAHEVDTVIHAYAPGEARTTKNRFGPLSTITTF